jgi:hypothetical protein
MTHETLRTLVREDATAAEPAFTLSADDVVRLGRRRVRRHRAVAGLASLSAAAAVAAAVLVSSLPGPGSGPSAAELDPATQQALQEYDAKLMPALVDETVRHAVGDTAPPFAHGEVSAEDSQGQRLPDRYLRYASMWVGSYDWGGDHLLRVALLHSGSESEGDPDAYCRSELSEGYSVACSVERDGQDRPVITSVTAVRRDGVTADPAQQTWVAVRHPERGNPDRLWFQRTVEVRRGGIYLTSVTEAVHAPSYAAAQRAWHLDAERLRTIATAPALVFPAPEKDDHGCDFVLHNEDQQISC